MVMPPTLRWALSRVPLRKEERARLEREAREEKGFVPNLERLLIAVDDSSNGRFATRVAGIMAGSHGMPTTVIHINKDAEDLSSGPQLEPKITDEQRVKKRPKVMAAVKKPETKKSRAAKTPRENADNDRKREQEIREVVVETPGPRAARKAEKIGETVKGVAEGVKGQEKKPEPLDPEIDVTTIVHKSPSAEAVALEAKKGYDLLVIGMDTASTHKKEFHPSVTQIAQGFDGPLAVTATRGELDKMPNNEMSILVPVNGTEQARRGAEVAILLARATNARMTLLYVAPRSADGKRKRRSRTRRHEEAILKDVVAMAGDSDIDIHTAVTADSAADNAILKEIERRKHNLVVLGVGRRPGERLFFGDTAAGLLAEAECSLLFLAS
jgi:nucleotide-binding universal stress UspA family protein